MQTAILISLIILSVLTTTFILLQNMGSGLGASLGGSSAGYQTRRGMESVIHKATIVCGILIGILSLTYLVI